MEQLQEMLVAFNRTIPEENRYSWSKQYLCSTFPCYWQVVFSELMQLDRSMSILEIGAGQGDVTSIACYLGFDIIRAYERSFDDFCIAKRKLHSLFAREEILLNSSYHKDHFSADILILVNCAYAEATTTKAQYMSMLKDYYAAANNPRIFILEVIDASFTIADNDFPMWIRLSEQDIQTMFPKAMIRSMETYVYPINKRSKKIYIIKQGS